MATSRTSSHAPSWPSGENVFVSKVRRQEDVFGAFKLVSTVGFIRRLLIPKVKAFCKAGVSTKEDGWAIRCPIETFGRVCLIVNCFWLLLLALLRIIEVKVIMFVVSFSLLLLQFCSCPCLYS